MMNPQHSPMCRCVSIPVIENDGMDVSISLAAMRFVEMMDTAADFTGIRTCPDCSDGFYYPLTGPREPCRTCKA